MTTLTEGNYEVWFEIDGVPDAKPTAVGLSFDHTAPQVQIVTPAQGAVWPKTVEVTGGVVPGWTIEIDGTVVTVDKGRFATRVAVDGAVVVRAFHPQRGIHYYVRHPRK